MNEKRRNRRIARRLLVRFGEADLDRAGVVSDISSGGIFVSGEPLPAIGARLHLRIELSPASCLYAEGVVRRHKVVPARYRGLEKSGFGVRFLAPEELIGEVLPQLKSPALRSSDERFTVRFATTADLKAAFDRELRHGGVFLRTDRVLPRDTPVVLTLELEFAGQSFEFAAKVVQIVEGTARGLGFLFDDRAHVAVTVAPFV